MRSTFFNLNTFLGGSGGIKVFAFLMSDLRWTFYTHPPMSSPPNIIKKVNFSRRTWFWFEVDMFTSTNLMEKWTSLRGTLTWVSDGHFNPPPSYCIARAFWTLNSGCLVFIVLVEFWWLLLTSRADSNVPKKIFVIWYDTHAKSKCNFKLFAKIQKQQI